MIEKPYKGQVVNNGHANYKVVAIISNILVVDRIDRGPNVCGGMCQMDRSDLMVGMTSVPDFIAIH